MSIKLVACQHCQISYPMGFDHKCPSKRNSEINGSVWMLISTYANLSEKSRKSVPPNLVRAIEKLRKVFIN